MEIRNKLAFLKMPQLAPINWLVLFFLFSFILVLTQVKIYYFFFLLKGKLLSSKKAAKRFNHSI